MKVIVVTTLEVLDDSDETILLEEAKSETRYEDKWSIRNMLTEHHCRLKGLWDTIKSII